MMLFNVTSLIQPMQNIVVFDISMDLILITLVYLRFYSSMSDRLSFHLKQHRYHLKLRFKCFFMCSIIKATYKIKIKIVVFI